MSPGLHERGNHAVCTSGTGSENPHPWQPEELATLATMARAVSNEINVSRALLDQRGVDRFLTAVYATFHATPGGAAGRLCTGFRDNQRIRG